MLDRTSVVTTTTAGLTVSGGDLAATTGIYSFSYTATSELTTAVTFQFTQFRNPISGSAKSGFFLFSLDNEGNVIDSTTASQSFPGPTSPATLTTTTDSMEFREDGTTTDDT